ncbi:MAG: Lrp/AsnC family transcriptional regulator [Pseudomonadota bacterium]
MKIDEITIAIIKHLRDGRKSFREIAEDLSLSENTIRGRVARMKDEGLLDIAGWVDPQHLPGHAVVMIGVSLKGMDLVSKAEEFSRLRGVVSVSVVTGRFDLIVTVLLGEGFGILEFYTQEASRLEGVGSVETFVVYKAFNLRVPYVL